MAQVQELFADRSEVISDNPSIEISFGVFDAVDEDDVKDVIENGIPSTVSGLDRIEMTIDERINLTTWIVIARYAGEVVEDEEEESEGAFSFDTGGGVQHITHSIKTVGKFGPGISELLQGAIRYDGERILGVDIIVPTFKFTETHVLPNNIVTDSFKLKISNLTGRTNSNTFRGNAPGSVLFEGASGSKGGNGKWSITYRFAVSPNASDIEVGEIKNIEKAGWEYLWVRYEDTVDEAAGQIVKKAIAVYVEQVYESTQFQGLGIN